MFLSCSDITAKYLSASVPTVEIAWLRYSVFLLIMLPGIFYGGPRGCFDPAGLGSRCSALSPS